MSNDPQIYGRDDTILALNDAIENLGDHTTGGVFVRYRKALTNLRDSLAARPIVGEVHPLVLGLMRMRKELCGGPGGAVVDTRKERWRVQLTDAIRVLSSSDFGGKQ
jgi:hypothetical protein